MLEVHSPNVKGFILTAFTLEFKWLVTFYFVHDIATGTRLLTYKIAFRSTLEFFTQLMVLMIVDV